SRMILDAEAPLCKQQKCIITTERRRMLCDRLGAGQNPKKGVTNAKQQRGGGGQGGQPCEPRPGTRRDRYGRSLPGLTGFTANRCEGTDRVAITNPTDAGRAIVTACPQVTSRFFSCNQTGMCGIGHPPADERWPAGVGILSRYHLQETLHAT